MSKLPVGPGEAVGWNGIFLRNTSAMTLELREIEPVGIEGGSLADIVGIEIGRRGRPPISSKFYRTYPPVEWLGSKKKCGSEPLFAVDGHQLEPGAEAKVHVVMQVAEDPGLFSVGKWRIEYTDGGGVVYQEIPFTLKLRVEEEKRTRRLLADERPCLSQSEPLADAIRDGSYPSSGDGGI